MGKENMPLTVKQISIFLENKAGRLADVTKALGESGINIRALSIADTADFGILRLIVNQPEKAMSILKKDGFMVNETEVIAVEIPDQPGGLGGILATMSDTEINIEYCYAFVEKASQDALVIFRVENPCEAIAALRQQGISILSGDTVYSI